MILMYIMGLNETG